jgi:hypothetical protein
MSYNISEIIGVVPHPIEEISFQVWFKNYYVHIVNLMDIFNQELSSIEPFCNNRKLQNPEVLVSFAKYLYIKSSRHIQ